MLQFGKNTSPVHYLQIQSAGMYGTFLLFPQLYRNKTMNCIVSGACSPHFCLKFPGEVYENLSFHSNPPQHTLMSPLIVSPKECKSFILCMMLISSWYLCPKIFLGSRQVNVLMRSIISVVHSWGKYVFIF